MESIGTFWNRLIELRSGLDKEGTITNISSNKRMEGANAWLLMCSIMIASLGLDLDNQAVIIGAMLISPLMSPILGVGMSVGINDRKTLMISLRHFSIAIAIALVTSTLYFFLTPFGEITEEILRRTEPTFLDVLVAFFGGIAGIISGSRKDQSSAIPGVAIATALMPPLCVTGFGLSKLIELLLGMSTNTTVGEVGDFILNSFYLFFLNSFFVALATFLIVRHLRFPVRKFVDPKARRRTTTFMLVFSSIMAIPSFFLLNDVLTKLKNERHVETFIAAYIGEKRKFIDETKLIERAEGYTLILKVYGSTISEEDIAYYEEGLASCGLSETTIEIISTSEIDLQVFEELQSKVSDVSIGLEEKLDAAHELQQSRETEIRHLREMVDSLGSRRMHIDQVCQGAITLLSGVQSVRYARPAATDSTPVFFMRWSVPRSTRERREKEKQLQEYLEQQLDYETVRVVSYN